MTNEQTNRPSWKIRRRWVARICVFSMGIISYSVWKKYDPALVPAFTCLSATLAFYVAGATAEDVMRK